jgi:2,3-dihydroxyphenylpropionate 1,2-dioxygenase
MRSATWIMVKLVCASHTPLMEFNSPDPQVDAEVRKIFGALKQEIENYDPELIVLFAPDHYNGMFYDMMPSFCVGLRAAAVGDWDSGHGDLLVPEQTALELLESVRADGIDAALSYKFMADHGFTQPLNLLTGSLTRYPVIPIFINAAAPPLPSCERTALLGAAVGRFCAKLDRRVLLVASGGLSHDPPFPSIRTASPQVQATLIDGRHKTEEMRKARMKRVIDATNEMVQGRGPCLPLNETWDRNLLHAFAQQDMQTVSSFTEAWIRAEGGNGGQEIRTWIAAFAALNEFGPYSTDLHYYRPIAEWNAGMAMMTAVPAGESAA